MIHTWIASIIGNILGFVAGTSLTWTSPELDVLKNPNATGRPVDEVYDDSSQVITWLGAILSIGAFLGPILWGYSANKIGRKYTIIAIAGPFALSYALLAYTGNVICFLIARLIIGVSIGGVFTVLPMYLGELAADSNRGAIGASMNCFICFGIFFSYAVGPYVEWLYFNTILAAFPLLFIIIYFFCAPETPQYLLSKSKEDKAKATLQKLRGSDVDTEFKSMQVALESETKGGIKQLFASKGNRKALIISVGLVSMQQFSGINAVLFFAQDIFTAAGTTIEPAVCSIFVGITQFSTSFVTPLVADRLGRKILLIFSGVGMAVSEIPLGVFFYLQEKEHDVSNIGFLPILCLILYIITYNCGFGPLPWAVMAEVFPSNVKSIANTFTASSCWFISFLITYFFPTIVTHIGQYSAFWIFGGFSLFAAFFSAFYVIETKGKSVTEIQEILNS